MGNIKASDNSESDNQGNTQIHGMAREGLAKVKEKVTKNEWQMVVEKGSEASRQRMLSMRSRQNLVQG